MKKIVAILFLLIVSIQFLPIKQMGKALFDNQFVEEEVCKHGVPKSSGISAEQELLIFDLTPQFIVVERCRVLPANTALHQHPVTDIVAPPPNARS
jgi:hypothetical protein